jgi:hypothetical protein
LAIRCFAELHSAGLPVFQNGSNCNHADENQRKDAKAQRRQGTPENFFATLRLCALALKNDVAPTELKNLFSALATNMSRLRRWELVLAQN